MDIAGNGLFDVECTATASCNRLSVSTDFSEGSSKYYSWTMKVDMASLMRVLTVSQVYCLVI